MSALNAAIRYGRSRNCFRFSINSRTRARARAHAADSSFREPVFRTLCALNSREFSGEE